MIASPTRLVSLVQMVSRLPVPPAPVRRGRGRPRQYPDRLFVQALVIRIVRRVTTVYGLLQMLAEETEEMHQLRAVLTADGPMPCRRTWERRLHAIPATLPAHIACFGAYLVQVLQPWQHAG